MYEYYTSWLAVCGRREVYKAAKIVLGYVKKCGKCKIAHLEILPCPAKRSFKPNSTSKSTPPKPKPRTQPPQTEEKKNSGPKPEVESNHSAIANVTSYTPLTVACFLENKETGQLFPTILYQDNGGSHTIVHRPLAEEAGLEGEEEDVQMTTMQGTEIVKGVYTDQFALVSMDKSTRWQMGPKLPTQAKNDSLRTC